MEITAIGQTLMTYDLSKIEGDNKSVARIYSEILLKHLLADVSITGTKV